MLLRSVFISLLLFVLIILLGVIFVSKHDAFTPCASHNIIRSQLRPRCQQNHYIYYNKVHKTGSTTLANILYRYGDERDLTFVMPQDSVWFDWPQHFHLFNIRPLYGQEANILCCHTRYNKGPVNFLFPKEKANYITLIRNPISHFESVFNYIKQEEYRVFLVNYTNMLRTHLQAPLRFEDMTFNSSHPSLHLLRNPALFDLGLDFKHFQNHSAVMSYIEFIDKEFDLVMITDYFDESLILLKELMCWEFEDIWYIKLRFGGNKAPLSEEVKKNILSWNQADTLLFDYFNKSFWRKVSDMGPKFYDDLRIFRAQNSIIREICQRKQWKDYTLIAGRDPNEFRQMCNRMVRGERHYIKFIKDKMDRIVAEADNSPFRERFGRSKESWFQGHDLLYSPVQIA